jgi:hypothetical protein
MKAYERRERGLETYFKLATWDRTIGTWVAGKVQLNSETEAREKARKPGRYRVERFDGRGSVALEPFEV